MTYKIILIAAVLVILYSAFDEIKQHNKNERHNIKQKNKSLK